MEHLYEKASASAAYLKEKLRFAPKVAVVLGSGLGDLTAGFTDTQEIPYADIPSFPQSTVAGHKGALLEGKLGDTPVLAMEGRFHFYEGYTMKEVCYPFYVFKLLGIETVVLTNAAGGINRSFDLLDLARSVADGQGIQYKEGVYLGFMGPCYETAAEIRAFAAMGADAVGMSTVPEAMVCAYLGVKVLAVSCITNMATGIQTVRHSHERVLEIANQAGDRMCRWLGEVIQKL